MKRFIFRSFLLAAISAMILGGWSCALLWAEISAYRTECHAPPEKEVLVCGDSQTEASLDPGFWPSLFNFSQSATALDQSYLKLMDILAANPGQFKTLLVDLSPIAIYTYNPEKPLVDAGPCATLFLLHCLHPKDNVRQLSGLPRIFRDTILAKRTRALWKTMRKGKSYRSSLRGGYLATDKRGFVEFREKVREELGWKANEINGARPLADDSPAAGVLRDTVALARTNGVKVVFISTPLHRALRAKIDPKRLSSFRDWAAAFARDQGCPYFDHLSDDFPDEQWRDANHINRFAAPELTKRIRMETEESSKAR
jgi:hypothetical protein